jgi:hypothetical protein
MTQAVSSAGAHDRRSPEWRSSIPADLTPLGSSGRSYRGRLDDGTELAVRRVPVDSAEDARRMLDYLKQLSGYASPFLVPVWGAEYRDGAIWVMSELVPGLALRDLMARWPLSPSQVVAIGLDLLSGLQALQELGVSHGNLHAGNVHVTPDGRLQLGDYGLRPRFRPDSARLGWPDPRIDLVAAGLLLCSALGIPARSEGSVLSPAERSVPALVAAVRVMAEGGAGRFAGSALGLFEEASGSRARPVHLQQSHHELGDLVSGRQRPLASPAPPEPQSEPAPPSAAPSAAPPGRVRSIPWLPLAAVLALLLLLLAGWVLFRPGTAKTVASPGRSPAASPAANPGSSPAQGSSDQASAGAPAPVATPPPADDGAPAPTAGAVTADSPTGAVSQFYDRVVAHDFDGALQLWSSSMQSTYPRSEYVDGRFSNTSSMALQRNQLVSSDAGQATVAIDLVEVRGGRTYHWVGNWYLVQSGPGWLLDRPSLRPA